MKKIFITTCIAMVIGSGAFAQKPAAINEMVITKNFVFIATKVERRETYSGSVYLLRDGYFTSPVVLGLEYNTNVYDRDYSQVINGDGDYFGDYRLRTRQNAPSRYSGETVFLIQNADHILIREQQAPITFNEIEDSDFYDYQPEQYQLKSVNKGNKKWSLTYELANGRRRKEMKLEVSENGKATLKTLRDNNSTVFLYGYITKPADVKKL